MERIWTAVAVLLLISVCEGDEVWEKDMSEDIYIEGSHEGFEHVKLRCTDVNMEVEILMEDSFDGIFYTRGSYKSAKLPCYFDATGDKVAKLQMPLDGCKNKRNEETGEAKNTVIVQHDDWLIYPGDTAFEIACEGKKASIGLADPDPGAAELPKHRKSTVTSEDGEVTFTPEDIRPKQKNKSKTKKTKKKKTNKKNLKTVKNEEL